MQICFIRALHRESVKTASEKGQCGNLDPGMMNEGGKWQAVIPDPLTAVSSFHRSTEDFFSQVDHKLNFMMCDKKFHVAGSEAISAPLRAEI